jgi:hypothetical protein
MEEEKNITPSQYFDYLKDAKNQITTEALKKSYGTFVALAEKYKRLGQKESLKKLSFLVDTLLKEEKLIDLGITTYVYKNVIEDYITKVADKAVKIVELSRYMREVPDELVEIVEKTRDIFDEFYVVFTDYTGKEERKVEKERRDKDPILFGAFKNNANVADRFYFLGDWIDEYCDLTLDKMIEEYSEKIGHSPSVEIKVPESAEELLEVMKAYKPDCYDGAAVATFTVSDNTGIALPVGHFTYEEEHAEKKHSFFDKVRSVFSRKK